jgi:hypothetical protein
VNVFQQDTEAPRMESQLLSASWERSLLNLLRGLCGG